MDLPALHACNKKKKACLHGCTMSVLCSINEEQT